jgi:hypothetical protein
MRALAFTRSNVRAGEKAIGPMVIFQAAAVREASPEERKQLQEARKAQKIQAKQRRAQRKAERDAARTPEPVAAAAHSEATGSRGGGEHPASA